MSPSSFEIHFPAAVQHPPVLPSTTLKRTLNNIETHPNRTPKPTRPPRNGAARIRTGVTSARGSYDFKVDWRQMKPDLVTWLDTKNYEPSYRDRILCELEKRVGVIVSPMDVVRVFEGLTHGQQHNLNRAVRALFNFCEEGLGVDESYLKPLRKAIPQDVVGADVKIPTRSEILKSLAEVVRAPLKYQALYNLLTDSGLRETEACRLINEFEDAEEIHGILRCPLGYFRGTKLAYLAYFTTDTLKLLKDVKDLVKPASASAYFYKRGYVAGKYLRKFMFDTMISLNIPESVADFIQGRVPIKIGAKHYLALMRRADQFYPRYAKYVAKLR